MSFYTAQDYRKLKRLWLKWACDFTYENIKRLEKFFPERSAYSLAIHLRQVLLYHDRDEANWLKFENDYKRVKMKEQKERRGKALTQVQKTLILKKYNYKCEFCGKNLNPKDIQRKVEFHHIIPVMRGGTNKLSNYQPLHYKCHKQLPLGACIRFLRGKTYLRVGRNLFEVKKRRKVWGKVSSVC